MSTTRNDDVTVTLERSVAEALCWTAGMSVTGLPQTGPGTWWADSETGDIYNTTEQALVKALPRIAENAGAEIDGRKEAAEREERQALALTLLEKMRDLQPPMSGERGYTMGLISRIEAGEDVTDEYLEQLRIGVGKLEVEEQERQKESPAEELGRLRRQLSEMNPDSPEHRDALDRIAVLTREQAVTPLELRAGQSLGENEPQQPDEHIWADDEQMLYDDRTGQRLDGSGPAVLIERPRPGAKVLFVHEVDRYPHFKVPAGATGTVVENADGYYSVQLDKPIAGAEEWDNSVVWSIRDGEEPQHDIRPDFVNHDEIARMTYLELGQAIEEGGPSDLINALIAERRERQRKADSVFSDEWDANGTITVPLPAVNFGPWLSERGWTFTDGKWRSPIGDTFWGIDEALQRQLLAEAIGGNR